MSKQPNKFNLTNTPSSNSSQPQTHTFIDIFTAVVLAVIVNVLVIKFVFPAPKIAYVDTGKLMVGFNEANKVNREIKDIDDEWKKKLKALQDSLAKHVELMSKEYDASSVSKKKKLQDKLSALNQRINNFREANNKKVQKLQQEKMQGVLDKANIYITEYGKKKGYDIIMGAIAGGSILYGDQRKYDITNEIIEGLNERYK